MFALKLSVFSLVLFTEPPFALRMPPQILTWKTGWHKLHFWFKNLTTKIRRDRRGLQSQAGYYWQKSKPFLQHWWVNHLWRGDIFLLDFYLIWSFYQGNPAALPRLNQLPLPTLTAFLLTFLLWELGISSGTDLEGC